MFDIQTIQKFKNKAINYLETEYYFTVVLNLSRIIYAR